MTAAPKQSLRSSVTIDANQPSASLQKKQSSEAVHTSATVQNRTPAHERLTPRGKIAKPDFAKSAGKNSKPRLSDVSHTEGLRISYRLLRSIKAYERNSRTHSAKQIKAIEASLQTYGWTTPLLIAGDDLLAGHARREAALNLLERGISIAHTPDGLMAPTIDLSHLSAAARRAYIIADNKLAEAAGWDNELLRLELADLQGQGFDLSLTGFSAPQLETLLGVTGEVAAPQMASGMRYQLVIDCDGEQHQASLLSDMIGRGLKARPLIL